MIVKRGVHVEEKTAETASDYDADINFIVNSGLSKSEIDNEQDFLEWTDHLCQPGFLSCPTILWFVSSTVVQFATDRALT